MQKGNRPCLCIWSSSFWIYAQVVDKPTGSVLAAARARAQTPVLLARQLAARCLAAGVFELRYINKYAGNAIKIITNLRTLGILI
ncbi:hypothetical protein AADW59_00725 [Candidatus Hodgkinia cicadicola]